MEMGPDIERGDGGASQIEMGVTVMRLRKALARLLTRERVCRVARLVRTGSLTSCLSATCWWMARYASAQGATARKSGTSRRTHTWRCRWISTPRTGSSSKASCCRDCQAHPSWARVPEDSNTAVPEIPAVPRRGRSGGEADSMIVEMTPTRVSSWAVDE